MRITDIKCYVLPYTAAPMEYHWRKGLEIPDVSGRTFHSGIVRVETDDGIVGHTGGGNGYHLAELTERFWKPVLVGENPLCTERLWHRLWELHRVGGGNVAAMDQAFWDIKSQAAGLPLWQMLGGNDPRVPAYASTVTWDTMAEYEQHIQECVAEGFFAFKLHASGNPSWDADLAHSLRRWVGPGPDLMFDASGGWDYATSLWFGRVLEEAGYLWYEEPMREYDLPSYAELCRTLDIPILGAETCEGAHWNMATWIQQRALDMVRISTYKGGYTGAIKIAHLAESFSMRAQVHGADMTLCAAVPNNDYVEVLVVNTEQIRALKDQGPMSVVGGYMTAADAPGAGPQPDWADVERRAVLVV